MIKFSADVIALIAPGKMAITDYASGTARETYRKARRLARMSLNHHPAALQGGRRTHTMISFYRADKFYVVDSVRRPT